jgi:hypothetical protein
MRAHIQLKADVSEAGDAWSDSQIAEGLETSLVTFARIRQQLVEEGVDGDWQFTTADARGLAPAAGRCDTTPRFRWRSAACAAVRCTTATRQWSPRPSSDCAAHRRSAPRLATRPAAVSSVAK